MVNKKQLSLIKKGVSTWSEWIQKNADAETLPEIDLSGADLRRANLSGADLRNAYLNGADLSKADLIGADLWNAILSEAYLSRADLSKADLIGANLNGADLRSAELNGAHLGGANLSKANLNGADLIEADLRFANLNGTNLSNANLSNANLSNANLSNANLIGADLSRANLSKANLSKANLSKANLSNANLIGTDLRNANLRDANLSEAYLRWANLSEANLIGTDLSMGIMVETNLNKANLTECRIYGVSAWDLELGTEKDNNLAIQKNLIITPQDEPNITVDNLEVAQFIYLILNNQKLRGIIDTITSKTVLILGRFTLERKAILDALKEELRNLKYLPILFDFEKPGSRSLTDTVTLLARMSRFIIADISDPKSVPHELYAIVPTLKSVPVQLILDRGSRGYPMVVDILDSPQVIEDICLYDDLGELLGTLKEKVINPAESRAKELEERRNKIEEKYKELERELKGKP